MIKGMDKVGRKPKGWKPPYTQTLQIKKEEIKITFDGEAIEGDLKDFMMKPKVVAKQAEQAQD